MTARFRCSGRTAAAQVACSFTTDDEAAASAHFEQHDHDVQDAALPGFTPGQAAATVANVNDASSSRACPAGGFHPAAAPTPACPAEAGRMTYADIRATELHGERHWLLALSDRSTLVGEEPDVYVMTARDLQVLIGQATKALARRLRPDADAVDAADVLHARLAAMRDV